MCLIRRSEILLRIGTQIKLIIVSARQILCPLYFDAPDPQKHFVATPIQLSVECKAIYLNSCEGRVLTPLSILILLNIFQKLVVVSPSCQHREREATRRRPFILVALIYFLSILMLQEFRDSEIIVDYNWIRSENLDILGKN